LVAIRVPVCVIVLLVVIMVNLILVQPIMVSTMPMLAMLMRFARRPAMSAILLIGLKILACPIAACVPRMARRPAMSAILLIGLKILACPIAACVPRMALGVAISHTNPTSLRSSILITTTPGTRDLGSPSCIRPAVVARPSLKGSEQRAVVHRIGEVRGTPLATDVAASWVRVCGGDGSKHE